MSLLFIVRLIITHRFPAADAPAAYAMLCDNRQSAMGVVLEWSDT